MEERETGEREIIYMGFGEGEGEGEGQEEQEGIERENKGGKKKKNQILGLVS